MKLFSILLQISGNMKILASFKVTFSYREYWSSFKNLNFELIILYKPKQFMKGIWLSTLESTFTSRWRWQITHRWRSASRSNDSKRQRNFVCSYSPSTTNFTLPEGYKINRWTIDTLSGKNKWKFLSSKNKTNPIFRPRISQKR